MKYLLLICTDKPFEADPRELDAGPWVEEMDRRGVRLMGDRLRPPADATTVRVRDGEVLVTDGPFLETKEALGGFYLIEAADLDEAIALAKALPEGIVEVRPLAPMRD